MPVASYSWDSKHWEEMRFIKKSMWTGEKKRGSEAEPWDCRHLRISRGRRACMKQNGKAVGEGGGRWGQSSVIKTTRNNHFKEGAVNNLKPQKSWCQWTSGAPECRFGVAPPSNIWEKPEIPVKSYFKHCSSQNRCDNKSLQFATSELADRYLHLSRWREDFIFKGPFANIQFCIY